MKRPEHIASVRPIALYTGGRTGFAELELEVEFVLLARTSMRPRAMISWAAAHTSGETSIAVYNCERQGCLEAEDRRRLRSVQGCHVDVGYMCYAVQEKGLDSACALFGDFKQSSNVLPAPC